MVCEVESDGADVQRHSRADYVGAGLRAAAIAWKALASEHAEAKATRIRDAVSITRAATLRSRRRRGCELGGGKRSGFWDGLSEAPHQPVGGGMQDQPHLVGIGQAAGGAIAGKLRLVHLDEVLGLAASAVERIVDVLGRATCQRGDDIADVHAQSARLDPGGDAALAFPALRPVAGLGIIAQDHSIILGALDRAGIGGRYDDRIGAQRCIGGKSEDIVDAVCLAEGQDFRPAIVPITADGDVGVGPVPADMPHETPEVSGRLRARGCLASAQQHGDRPTRGRIVNVDRQETALAVMAIPERQLLVAVNDIAGIIDIQRHRLGRLGIAGAIDADHDLHHARQLACGRRVFPAAHRWLAGKTCARSRQLAERQAEAGIIAQSIKVVSILVAAADCQNPRPQDVIELVDHPRLIARIRNAGGEPGTNLHLAIGLRQQQNAPIRRDPTTVEGRRDFLADDRWKRNQLRTIVTLGGCGLWSFFEPRCRFGLGTQFPTTKQMLTPLPPTLSGNPLNNTG